MKIAVVTAIYGGYDKPKPLPDTLGASAYLYTDDQAVADAAADLGWWPIVAEAPTGDVDLTPMLKAKYWKTHPLIAAPGYDVSIWLDGSMTILEPAFVQLCLDALGNDDLSMTPHPERRCIHPEAQVTAGLARYADCDPIEQVEFYRSFGHPDDWGLFASGASTRRHTTAVECWGEHWWDDCVAWTYQDQLSLPVVTRIMESRGLRWNTNMPWHKWWSLAPHGY